MTADKETGAATPRLEPPGAGLPKVELMVARCLFHGKRLFTTRENALRTLEEEEAKILTLLSKCDEAMAEGRVLIARLPGMEDSSRHWSVYMTLDHLRIVNGGIAGTIAALLAGREPRKPASTAAVKPAAHVTAAVVPEFAKSCANLKSLSSSGQNLKTPHRFAHPWFGPLDASGWFFMAGFHMRLHRRQIERIMEGWKERSTGLANSPGE